MPDLCRFGRLLTPPFAPLPSPPSPSRHRRELASREHILVHAPGAGQAAFAPGRRDMHAYRAELERKRLDQLDKERREAAGLPELPSRPVQAGAQLVPGAGRAVPTAPLAGLRISQPVGLRAGPGVQGLRMAVPRPAVARPAVARPQPRAAVAAGAAAAPAATGDSASATSAPTTTSTTTESARSAPAAVTPAVAAPPAAPTTLHGDPSATPEAVPLLPSHLCSSYFVEPLSWMAGLVESGALSGKIACPGEKCGAKLGNFDWAGGREWAAAFCWAT